MLFRSVGADSYALMQIANYLATNGIKLVPDIQVSGGADGRGGSIVDAFVAMALSKGIVMPQPPGAGPPRPAAE